MVSGESFSFFGFVFLRHKGKMPYSFRILLLYSLSTKPVAAFFFYFLFFYLASSSISPGAMTAMQDAIALANLIYALPENTTEAIEKSFEEYHAERIIPVTESYNTSKSFSKAMERGVVGVIALSVMKNLPLWLLNTLYKRMILSRPQVGFLPEIELKGTVPPYKSNSTEKAKAVYMKRVTAVSL